MVITFVSNYINHHQLPFCRAMDELEDVEFHFIQTSPMEQKRVEMGWAVDPKAYSFVSLFYEEKEKCRELILNSDVTMFGWSDGIISDLEAKRLSSGKLSFRVSERIYREGQWKFISPKGLLRKYKEHYKYRNKPVYLLCTGAYVASDFALIKSYPHKMLKWGYFPEGADENNQTSDSIREPKEGDKLRLCFAGRLIELKHAEYAVKAAKALLDKKIDFTLDIVGDGNKRDELEKLTMDMGLTGQVRFHGARKPAEVRSFMKEADIFLFTSNYLEGWGAVVNEAMQSGCCVVASAEAGAVPFLIKDGENGLIYKDGRLDQFISKVIYAASNREKVQEMGLAAQKTIDDIWNARAAAKELVRFCKEYEANHNPVPSKDGPMSVAEVIKPAGFFRTLQEKNKLE